MAELKAALDGIEARAEASRRWLVGAMIAAALAVVAAFVAMRGPGEASHGQTVKFTFTPANLGRGNASDVDAEVSVSPNGKHVTYVEAEGGQLWVRDLSQEQARKVPGATRVYQVFWSPDSRQIRVFGGRRTDAHSD